MLIHRIDQQQRPDARANACRIARETEFDHYVAVATLAQSHEQKPVREIEIIVDGAYKPNRIEVQEGERVRLRFVRKEYSPCTREVVFPKLNIRRELPPNQPVVIELPALAPGEYEFKCGMNMIRGTLVVNAHGHH